MIFSELYGAYYNAVAAILAEAVDHPVSDGEMRDLIKKYAFSESVWAITDAMKREDRWYLLREDGSTPITQKPSMPLTNLQKRWLKAIYCDPRIQLFGEFESDERKELEKLDVEPLFLPTDYLVFDKYADGDPYTDKTYRANFRQILDAIKGKYLLRIELLNRKGKVVSEVVFPEYLEYSEKDDKFRLIGAGDRFGSTINLGRIIKCEKCEPDERSSVKRPGKRNPARPRTVVFELKNERNALERVLLHFAHFKKTAERIADNRYSITIHYDKEDETELVIRILSFGPMIRVTAPGHFIGLIKQRLMDQKMLQS